MRDIEVISGFAKDVSDNGDGISFCVGSPPISLTLGAMPKRAPPGTFGPPPIGPNEWIAVAVRRSAWEGSGYALLAYRRLGLRGSAHATNFTLAAWLLVLSVAGAALSFTADQFSTAFGYAACFALLAIPCLYRIVSVRRAARLLQSWEPPV
jgi:hypothetical protein